MKSQKVFWAVSLILTFFAAVIILSGLSGCQTIPVYAPIGYDPAADPEGEQLLTQEEFNALSDAEKEYYAKGTAKIVDPVKHKKTYVVAEKAISIGEKNVGFLPEPFRTIGMSLLALAGYGLAYWQKAGKKKIWLGFSQVVASIDKVLSTEKEADVATGLALSTEQVAKLKLLLTTVQDTSTEKLVDEAQSEIVKPLAA